MGGFSYAASSPGKIGFGSQAKSLIKGGSKKLWSFLKDFESENVVLAQQMMSFEGLAMAGAEPDVLLGVFPLYLAQSVESGKSNKQLRFRAIGGHVMWMQKGDGNTLIIKFNLVGPFALLYLQIIYKLYYYGSEQLIAKDYKLAGTQASGVVDLGAQFPGGADFGTRDGGTTLALGKAMRPGQGGNIVQGFGDVTTPGSGGAQFIGNDVKDTSMVPVQSNDTMPLYNAKTTKAKQLFDDQGNEIESEDFYMDTVRKTFNVVTRHEIYQNMYIETMLTREGKDLAQGEIEVDLLLRRYIEPPPMVKYTWTEASKTSMPGDKRNITKAKNEYNEALKNAKKDKKYLTKQGKVNAAVQKKYNLSGLKAKVTKAQNADEAQPRTTWRAGDGYGTKWQKAGYSKSMVKQQQDKDAVSARINGAWRAWGVARRIVMCTGWTMSNDPLIGRLIVANKTVSGKWEEKQGSAVRAPLNELELDATYTGKEAPNTIPGINSGYASSLSFDHVRTFAIDPTDLASTYDGKTGVTRYHRPATSWRALFNYMGEDGDAASDIDDVLVVTPPSKKDDLERTLKLGCEVIKVSGCIPMQGRLSFSTPFVFSIEVVTSQNNASEALQTKMITVGGDVEITINQGLTVFIGSPEAPSWTLSPVDGLIHVNKKPLDEAYFYYKSLEFNGRGFMFTAFVIYPSAGA